MLAITLKKLLAKRWMFFCMLLGCVLLIATTISLPLYENAVFDKMLRDEFQASYQQTGEWPAKYFRIFTMRRDSGGQELVKQEEFLDAMEENLGVTTKENIRFYKTVERWLHTLVNRDDVKEYYKSRLSMMSDLGEHVELVSGRMYSEEGYTEDGYLEIVVTYNCMMECDLWLDEIREFEELLDGNGKPLRVKLVGVIRPLEGDLYWEIGTDRIDDAAFLSESAFRGLFLGEDINDYMVTGYHCYLFEYEDLVSDQAEEILDEVKWGGYETNTFEAILTEYEQKRFRISATLILLQVPMIILLVAFLFMISKQMYEVERNEIAVMKSRGSSGLQVFQMYFYQTGILAGLGVLLGIPLGIGFFRMLGSASGFLEFKVRRNLEIVLNEKVFLYLGIALLLMVCAMSLPALKHSRTSIVSLKQSRVKHRLALWEICLLDFICLFVAGYGYYTYSRMGEHLAESVLRNEPLNPLLYISSSLLIVGLGLLFLRILPLLIKLLFKVGERLWRPAAYASFLEILRNGRKQHFIMLFLVLTIAFGIYHATMAQTIIDNAVNNASHLAGADVVLKEYWEDNLETFRAESSVYIGGELVEEEPIILRFYPGDYGQFETMDVAESYTKVYYDDTSEETDRADVLVDGTKVSMMLIRAKDFGENTRLEEGLNEDHYYTYLNLLTDNKNGFLISANYAEDRGYQVGDQIELDYYMYMDENMHIKDSPHTDTFNLVGNVVGIFEYWPGYNQEEVYLDKGDNIARDSEYLIVGNYAVFESMMGPKIQPYEVWITLKEDVVAEDVDNWIIRQDMKVLKYRNKLEILENTITDPLLQGTNGILTMEFVVMILLCGVGYLVYWMMSIRDREMLFGVFRAFGMHRAEIFGMLLLEQLLSGVLTIFVAMGIGKLAVKLFAPIMLESYTAMQQVLPMEMALDAVDMYRLYGAMGLVLLICLVILARFVFEMNVAEALKLGED